MSANSAVRKPVAIVDTSGRVIAVLAGRPVGCLTWDESVRKVEEAIATAGSNFEFPATQDRRGKFRTFAVGVSYGGGQMVCPVIYICLSFCLTIHHQMPGNLQHDEDNMAAIDALLTNEDLGRVAGFADSECRPYHSWAKSDRDCRRVLAVLSQDL